MHHSGNLIHSGGELIDGAGLVNGVLSHLIHHLNGLGGQGNRLLHVGVHILHQLVAAFHIGQGALNQLLGLLGGLVGLGGQVAHLIGHHGEALAGGTGSGRLHGGVQGQNIGLEGDVLNGFDDLADVALAGQNVVHGLAHVPKPVIAHVDLLGGHIGLLRRGPGLVGAALGGGVNLVDGGGQLLHGAGLLCGALGQGLGPHRHLIRAGRNLVGGVDDFGHGAAQVIHQLLQVVPDGGKLPGVVHRGGDGQIARLQGFGDPGDVPDDVVDDLLGGAHGPAEVADLVVGGVRDCVRQIALAEGGNSLFRLLQGAEDDTDHAQVQEETGQHNQNGENDDDNPDKGDIAGGPGGLRIAFAADLVHQRVAGSHNLVQKGGALVFD